VADLQNAIEALERAIKLHEMYLDTDSTTLWIWREHLAAFRKHPKLKEAEEASSAGW